MKFVINGMKYDTDKMERVATVKKWYKNDSALTQIMFPGQEVGRTYSCELWKSEKGNWLLTHEEDFQAKYGEAVGEEEAKELLMERNRMAELEAHRYLQKCSMDSGTNMVETAQMVISLIRGQNNAGGTREEK